MKKELYIIFLVSIFHFQCDSGVEPVNIPVDNLYSVSSFISPQDSLFIAYVFKAQEIGSLTGSDLAIVNDASVIISNGILSDTLRYVSESERYEGAKNNLQIEALGTYYLTVQTLTGEILEATCTIPIAPIIPEITGYQDDDDYLFSISWDNPSGYKYFTLSTFAEGNYKFINPMGDTSIVQLVALLEDDVQFPLNDQAVFNVFDGNINNAYIAENPKLTVTLRNIEEGLFNYFNSYQDYDEWASNNIDNVIPNFREPQPIYSNIKGGVGIFAGFNQATVSIDF